jgi:hypothetical protein
MRFKYPPFYPDLSGIIEFLICELPGRKKQIAALFLLGLFLLIQGAKLLHTHEHDPFHDRKDKRELVSKTKHCDICDYHFAAAAITDASDAHSCAAFGLPSFFNFYNSVSITSTGLSYTDRGPPAVI